MTAYGRLVNPRVIEAYSLYEILFRTAKGPILIFKHAIAAIEMTEESLW